MTPTFSNWITNKKFGYAFREEGMLTLIHHRGVFLLLTDKVEPLPGKVDSLDAAITVCDAHKPPTGWGFVVGMWVQPGWSIRKEESHWLVYGEDGEPRSKKKFPRADMARKWCEVRKDRVGLNLRGPKPKFPPAQEEEE
jgi:hypothetical protein